MGFEEPVEAAPTLIEKTDTLEESALDLAELQSEMLYQLCLDGNGGECE